MASIPLPITTLPGVKPQEARGRLVNCYAEKIGDGVMVRGGVGLEQIMEITGHAHCRGILEVNGVLFVCLDSRLYTVTVSGTTYTAVDRGAVGGTDAVTFARNNKNPTPDVCLVADSVAYQCFAGSNVTAWPDADVGSPNSVTCISGFFVWTYGDGIYRVSGLNDTSVDTTDYASAESKPDTLYRAIPFSGDLLLFGSQTVEVWRDTGNESGSPFSYVTTIARGLANPAAVSGYEDGFANFILFAGDDGAIYRLNGYSAERVSTHSIERLVAGSERTTLEAGVYMLAGHACWVLSSSEWTLVYDITTGGWHERQSDGGRWRASGFVRAWNSWVTGDYTTGKLYHVSEDYHRDSSSEISAMIQTGPIKEFPARFRVNRVEVDVTTAIGQAAGENPIQTDPQMWVSWSLDGGYSWGSPIYRAFGAQGEASARIVLHGLGIAQPSGLVLRLGWATPSHVAVHGVYVEPAKLKN